jgi:hypothetical protein
MFATDVIVTVFFYLLFVNPLQIFFHQKDHLQLTKSHKQIYVKPYIPRSPTCVYLKHMPLFKPQCLIEYLGFNDLGATGLQFLQSV